MERLLHVTLILLKCLLIRSTFIVHNEKVIFENRSSYLFHSTSSLKQIITLAESHGDIENIAFFHDKRFNSLFSVYFCKQNYEQFDIDRPTLRDNLFEEYNVNFPYSLTGFFDEIIQESVQRLCIISFNSCTDQIIQNMLLELQSYKIASICNVFNPFDEKSMTISQLLKHIQVWDYTHLMLLLPPFHVYDVLTKLADLINQRPLKVYTTFLLPNHVPRQQQHLSMIEENHQWIEKRPVYLDTSVFNDVKILLGAVDVSYKKLSIRNRIKDKLRQKINLVQRAERKFKRTSMNISRVDKLYVRATSVVYPPYTSILYIKPNVYGICTIGHRCLVPLQSNKTTKWKLRCCDGLTITLFNKIAKELNFKYDLYLTEDGRFGGMYNNRTWSGMMGELTNNRADIAVQGFYPTKQRAEEVEFTTGIINDNYVFILRRNFQTEIKFVNWEFVKSMDAQLAIYILLSTIFASLFIIISENVGYFIRNKKHFSTREVMTYIFGLTFQRDMGGRNPLRWAGRLAALSYAAAMTIVMTTYTAHLTAKNIQTEAVTDFKGFQDKRFYDPTDDFKYSAVSDTATETRFRDNSQKIWQFMRKFYIADNVDGIEKVYNKELDAFLSDKIAAKKILSDPKYCEVLQIYMENTTETEAVFAYRKHFRLGKEITKMVLKLRENGEINYMVKKWMYAPDCLKTRIEFSQFDINYFGGIVLICGILFCVSVLLIFAENQWTYIKVKRTKASHTSF